MPSVKRKVSVLIPAERYEEDSPVPAPEKKPEAPAEKVDLTPIVESLDRIAEAMRSQPDITVAAPNVTVENAPAPASKPRSWICKHTYNASGDIVETKITAE